MLFVGKHLKEFEWIMISEIQKRIFCKYCFLFAKFGGISQQTRLQKLVITPLTNYSKLLGKDGDTYKHMVNTSIIKTQCWQPKILFKRSFLRPKMCVI